MKKILPAFVALFLVASANAQSAKELIGKWKLISWKSAQGKPKDIKSSVGSDEVYQVFKEGGEFESLVGEKDSKGSWKLSDDNKKLTIKSGIFTTVFTLDFFDNTSRVISTPQLGTLEYKNE